MKWNSFLFSQPMAKLRSLHAPMLISCLFWPQWIDLHLPQFIHRS